MTNDIEQLATEVIIGQRAAHAWDSYLIHYFQRKMAEISETFFAEDTEDSDLIELKRLHNALVQLELDIKNDIATGKMAAMQLDTDV